MKRVVMGAAAALALSAASAFAAKPAVIYDLGGKYDKSFNEAAYRGAEQFKKETKSEYREFEIQNDAQREQALRKFAKEGYDPIIAIGFSQAQALDTVAKEFPKTHFAIIDSVVDLPNVRSIVFKEQEGSYLVGILAAMASKTGKVGFVGGMDIPLIRRFACGYVQGVKSVKADATVLQNMTGTTGSAWNDPVRGDQLAKSQIDQGADVIYHAAGGTGIGVLQAAADAGKLGIGVDSDQSYLHPGSVLTSMVKRIDVAVYNTMKDGSVGRFSGGVIALGVAEGGVGWVQTPLVTPEMKDAVGRASANIKSGKVQVHDYMADSACPVDQEYAVANSADVVAKKIAPAPIDEKVVENHVEEKQVSSGVKLASPDHGSDGPQGRRVALVIGLGAYKAVPELANPPRDAADIAAELSEIGFDVTHLDDLDASAMRKALRNFEQEADGASIALVYYAGHGMEVNGTNYLVPVDAQLQRDTDIEDEAISLNRVLSAVAGAHDLRVVLLDACRNNPFTAKMARADSSRAVSRGLTRIEPGSSTLVAFSAKEGTIAEDGDGRHSPFARAILANLRTRGLEINFLFRRVRDQVMAGTGNRQEPFVYGSLSAVPIYLAGQ
jgi:basic membrane protein A